MTEYSYPFASGNGASVSQDQWSAMAKYWLRPGIPGDAYGTSLKVTAGTANLTTVVAPGEASLLGFYYRTDANITVTHAPNTSGLSRVDLVVLRLDMDNAKAYVATTALTGTPSANPVPPTPAGDYAGMGSRIWEIPLAKVLITNNATVITADKITDARYPGSADITTGTSQNRPDWSWRYRPFGTIHFEQDTRQFSGWDGAKWGTVAQFGPWQTYTPQVLWDNGDGTSSVDSGWTAYCRWKMVTDNAVAFSLYAKINYALNEGGSGSGAWSSSTSHPRNLQISLPVPVGNVGGWHDPIVPVFYQRGSDGGDMRTGFAHLRSGDNKLSWLAIQGNTGGSSWSGEAWGNLDTVNENTAFSQNTTLRLTGIYECAGA